MSPSKWMILPVAGLAMLAAAAELRGQTVKAGPLELDLTGRAQVQFNATSVGEDELGEDAPAGAAFEMRRVRLGTNFSYDEWITGKLEAELTGSAARLTDAYLDVPLSPAFSVRAGQFKKPFGLFELESNTRVITIERMLRIAGVEDLVGIPGEAHWLLDEGGYVGRDIGVMVEAGAGVVGVSAGIFGGEGANTRESDGSKAFAARVTAAPVAGLLVGAAVSSRPGVFDALGDEEHATAFAVDLEWGGFREEGLRVMAEAMMGDNPLLDPADDPSMRGLQAAASWFAPRDGRVEGVEPLLRVSWADPDTDVDDNEGTLVTPGINFYFTGRNRLMINGEAYVPAQDGVDTQYGLEVRMQIYF